MEDRKKDHIELALDSQISPNQVDMRFYYEPMLSGHPSIQNLETNFLGFKLKNPLWVSSMTGGASLAGAINRNLARACHDFGFGMGLGSCRTLLKSDTHLADFDVRDILGEDLPLFANIGISQVETLLNNNEVHKLQSLINKLRANGLVIHVNPMQEFVQPEGDRLKLAPIDTIKQLTQQLDTLLIVKEVGQGMGPESIKQLLQLNIDAIEFAAFGGTNFASIELQRNSNSSREFLEPFVNVGHTASQMLGYVNHLVEELKPPRCKSLIISGGIKNFLDGFYLIEKSKMPAIYGQASAFLQHARGDYSKLKEYVEFQLKGLAMAKAYLKIKE